MSDKILVINESDLPGGPPLILRVEDSKKLQVIESAVGNDIKYKLVEGEKILLMRLNKPITFYKIVE